MIHLLLFLTQISYARLKLVCKKNWYYFFHHDYPTTNR